MHRARKQFKNMRGLPQKKNCEMAGAALTVGVLGDHGLGCGQGIGLALGVDGPHGEGVLAADLKVVDFEGCS